MNIRPNSGDEWKILLYVIHTADSEWDLTIIDYSIHDDDADNDECYDKIQIPPLDIMMHYLIALDNINIDT